MKIGILMAGHTAPAIAERHGDFDTMFANLLAGQGFDFAVWDVENMVFPTSADAADGWLITGSKHGAYENHAFIQPLEAFIRDVYAADKPLVGICFGHQIIAQALGGKVVKFDGGWALGRHDYALADGHALTLNAWHQDQVVELPPGAAPVGQSPFCANAFLAYGQHALTIQPHPEFDDDIISSMVETRRGTGTYPDDLMNAAMQAAGSIETDRTRMARAIGAFFHERMIHVPT